MSYLETSFINVKSDGITMKVAVLQSNYIPWKGYFDIIHDVDLFIFYDDVQFTKMTGVTVTLLRNIMVRYGLQYRLAKI